MEPFSFDEQVQVRPLSCQAMMQECVFGESTHHKEWRCQILHSSQKLQMSGILHRVPQSGFEQRHEAIGELGERDELRFSRVAAFDLD